MSQWAKYLFVIAIILCAGTGIFAQLSIDKMFLRSLSPEDRLDTLTQLISQTDDPKSKAWIYHQIGNAYYELDQYAEAINATSTANQIRQSNELYDEALASAFNLGLYYAGDEKYDSAIYYFRSLLNPINRKTGVAYFQLARIFTKLDEIHLAGQAFDLSRSYSPFAGNVDLCAQIDLEWSDALLRTTQKEYMDSAITILKNLILTYGDPKSIEDNCYLLSIAYNRLGVAHSKIEDYSSAEDNYKKAISFNRAHCYDKQLLSDVYTNLGVSYRHEKLYDKTMESYQLALQLLDEEGNHIDSSAVFENIAASYLDQNRFEEALNYSNIALSTLLKMPIEEPMVVDDSSIVYHPYKMQLFNLLIDRAEIQRSMTNKESYLKILESGDKVLNAIKNQQSDPRTRREYRMLGKQLYSRLIEFNVNENKLVDALFYLERSKYDLIPYGANARKKPEIKKIEQRLIDLKASVKEKGADLQEDVKKEVSDLQLRLRELKKETIDQRIAVDEFTEIIKHIKKTLHPNAVILNYFISENYSVCAVIDQREIRFIELTISPDILEKMRDFRSACMNKKFPDRKKVILQHNDVIYETIIPERLLSDYDHVVLMLGGAVGNFPIMALRDSKESYVMQKWNVSQSLSFRHLMLPHKTKIGKVGFYSFVADSTYDGKLIHSEKEKSVISSFYTLIENRPIDKSNLSESWKDIDALHFASHGAQDLREADLSHINLGSEKIYLSEIWNANLNKTLVVAAACETGTGKFYEGEGMLTLGSAFVAAGAPNNITTLWKIDDHTTSEIVSKFYEYYYDDGGVGHALTRSIRDYYKNANPLFRDPYYWAGFVPLESISSLETTKEVQWFGYQMGIALLIILALIYVAVFNRKITLKNK